MAKKPLPRKTRSHAIPDEKIAEALKKTKGLQYLAAELLDINVRTMCERVQKSPYLQYVIKDCLEKRLDVAELKLSELAETRDLGAICFFLKTRGKQRGYSQDTIEIKSSNALEQYLNQQKDPNASDPSSK